MTKAMRDIPKWRHVESSHVFFCLHNKPTPHKTTCVYHNNIVMVQCVSIVTVTHTRVPRATSIVMNLQSFEDTAVVQLPAGTVPTLLPYFR